LTTSAHDVRSREFNGRTVAFIAAAHGIGPATVAAFTDAGARVAVDTDDEMFAHVALRAPFEATQASGIRGFFDRCEEAIGALDVLVIGARTVATGRILDAQPARFGEVIAAELTAPILCMQEAARRMCARGRGRIISFASMSGKTGAHVGVGAFAAAKGGLVTFSRALAAEVAASGVTVNVIATALFEPQVASVDAGHRAELLTGIPVHRFGRPAEAARAALFLASDDAGYITGETLNMSGGRFMD
jgi:3-oxoacyl-[acyl-carrier protein] reductase